MRRMLQAEPSPGGARMSGCPACSGSEFARVTYPGAERAKRAGLPFTTIAVCGQCGLGVAEPRVDQAVLDAFYGSGAYWEVAGSPAQAMHARNQCEQRARFIAGRAPPAFDIRVLDIGAGEGWLGAALRRNVGARVTDYHFVEPDPRLRERPFPANGLARRAFGSLTEAAGPYEIVFLNQVLEHVADPRQLLGRARELLAPEGILYVESPNADYRFKADVFPHTLFLTADALQRLGGRSGFDTLVCETFGRNPARGSGAGDLASRAGFRFALAIGADGLAQRFDDAYWDYRAQPDGLWLRWLGQKATA